MMGKKPSHHAQTGPGPTSKQKMRPMFDVKVKMQEWGKNGPLGNLKNINYMKVKEAV